MSSRRGIGGRPESGSDLATGGGTESGSGWATEAVEDLNRAFRRRLAPARTGFLEGLYVPPESGSGIDPNSGNRPLAGAGRGNPKRLGTHEFDPRPPGAAGSERARSRYPRPDHAAAPGDRRRGRTAVVAGRVRVDRRGAGGRGRRISAGRSAGGTNGVGGTSNRGNSIWPARSRRSPIPCSPPPIRAKSIGSRRVSIGSANALAATAVLLDDPTADAVRNLVRTAESRSSRSGDGAPANGRSRRVRSVGGDFAAERPRRTIAGPGIFDADCVASARASGRRITTAARRSHSGPDAAEAGAAQLELVGEPEQDRPLFFRR